VANADRVAEQPARDLHDRFSFAGRENLQRPAAADHPHLVHCQQLGRPPGDRLAGIDARDPAVRDRLDDRLQKRVVRAAEHDGVDSGFQ